MKKSDLKRLIKPIVKECILESLIEEGILSSIISEVVKGTQPVLENRQQLQENAPPQPQVDPHKEQALLEKQMRLEENRQQMISSINSDAYGGVNLFEGTTPAPAASSGPGSPLGDVDPGDAGVDISGILSIGASRWKTLSK